MLRGSSGGEDRSKNRKAAFVGIEKEVVGGDERCLDLDIF